MARSSRPWRTPLSWHPVPPSLRGRLTAAAVCLLAAGAGIMVVAGVLATRGHLTGQAEQQLRGYAGRLASRAFLLTPESRSAPGLSDLTAGAGALTVEVRDAAGRLVIRAGPGRPAGPDPHEAAAQVLAGRGHTGPVWAGRRGSYLAITVPIRYRAHRIPYAYSAEDFAVDVTSPAGTGSPGALVVTVSLARIGQATGRLAVIMLAVSGIVVVVTGFLAAWMIRGTLRPLTRPDQVAPALSALLVQVGPPAVPVTGPAAAARRAAEQKRRAIADTSRELRTPLSVLSGLTEYYRHHDQLGPADFHRLLARVAQETARIDAIIDDRLARGQDQPGQDQPGPPG